MPTEEQRDRWRGVEDRTSRRSGYIGNLTVGVRILALLLVRNRRWRRMTSCRPNETRYDTLSRI